MDNEISTDIGLFVDIFYDEEVFPEELKGIYISKEKDELFLVFDHLTNSIKEKCMFWDRKISSFIAFGSENRELLDKMKYNITQIILNYDNTYDSELESSLTISRKIFAPCYKINNDEYNIDEKNIFVLPFVPINQNSFVADSELLVKLQSCLPSEEGLDFLSSPIKKVMKKVRDNVIDKSYDEVQFEAIKGWLKNDN
jgi:hypothetical protein